MPLNYLSNRFGAPGTQLRAPLGPEQIQAYQAQIEQQRQRQAYQNFVAQAHAQLYHAQAKETEVRSDLFREQGERAKAASIYDHVRAFDVWSKLGDINALGDSMRQYAPDDRLNPEAAPDEYPLTVNPQQDAWAAMARVAGRAPADVVRQGLQLRSAGMTPGMGDLIATGQKPIVNTAQGATTTDLRTGQPMVYGATTLGPNQERIGASVPFGPPPTVTMGPPGRAPGGRSAMDQNTINILNQAAKSEAEAAIVEGRPFDVQKLINMQTNFPSMTPPPVTNSPVGLAPPVTTPGLAPTNAPTRRPTKALAQDYVNRFGQQAKEKLMSEGYDVSGYAD